MVKRSALWAVVCLCLAAPAAGQSLLVETATFNPTSANVWGFGDAGTLSYGVKFHVNTTTVVSRVGIGNLSGTGQFYAALVRLGPTGFPVGAPFNDAEAVGHATFTAAGGDQRIPLLATLLPGDYMLVMGAGKYSTTGSGEIATAGQTSLPGTSTYYTFHDGMWTPVFGFYTAGPDPLRFVIEGADEHQAILGTVVTRASQTSVDGLGATLATRASQVSVDGLSASVAAQYSSLFSHVNSRASQASLSSMAGAVGLKASQASVDALAASVALLSNTIATASSVNGVTTAVTTVADTMAALPSHTDLAGVTTALTTAIGSRASQTSVDAIAGQLDREESLRLDIEHTLAEGTRVAAFFLPSSVGGHLTLVREVVEDAITSAQQAGLEVTRPWSAFAKGESALRADDYKAAYDWYANAYQALIK